MPRSGSRVRNWRSTAATPRPEIRRCGLLLRAFKAPERKGTKNSKDKDTKKAVLRVLAFHLRAFMPRGFFNLTSREPRFGAAALDPRIQSSGSRRHKKRQRQGHEEKRFLVSLLFTFVPLCPGAFAARLQANRDSWLRFVDSRFQSSGARRHKEQPKQGHEEKPFFMSLLFTFVPLCPRGFFQPDFQRASTRTKRLIQSRRGQVAASLDKLRHHDAP